MITHPYTRSGENVANSGLYSSWTPHLQSHWGRSTWDALFLLASDFPHNQECDDDRAYTHREVEMRRKAWRQILLSLPEALSCPVCGEHFRRYMERHSVDGALRDRETLMRWLYRAKDEVNRRRGRTSPSFQRVRRTYIPPCRQSRRRRSRVRHVDRR